MMFVLGALALLQAASPPAVADQLSNGRWKNMSTWELAGLLLPRRIARRVSEHEITPPATSDGPPTEVTFHTAPYAMPDGFCERDSYRVSIGPDLPMAQTAEIRFGHCPRSAGEQLAKVDPQLHPAQAQAAVRWLGEAITDARSRKPLPFDIDCVAEGQPGLCAGGGRTALSRLAPGSLFAIAGVFSCKTADARFSLRQQPGRGVWNLRVEGGPVRPHLTMTWTAAPQA
ncbi:MAG TPA: hypothetical protein VFW39_04715 [Sphingomicrobium sp.]|nr:hypothetical protein [Sphingomicrobium sp.]